MKRTWTNAPGVYGREVFRGLCPYCPEWHVHADEGDGRVKCLPASLGDLFPPGATAAELSIHFLSSGYYDPGYIGTPDNNQPPEGDDERELDFATLDGVELSPELATELFELFDSEIWDAEFTVPEE